MLVLRFLYYWGVLSAFSSFPSTLLTNNFHKHHPHHLWVHRKIWLLTIWWHWTSLVTIPFLSIVFCFALDWFRLLIHPHLYLLWLFFLYNFKYVLTNMSLSNTVNLVSKAVSLFILVNSGTFRLETTWIVSITRVKAQESLSVLDEPVLLYLVCLKLIFYIKVLL